MFKYNNFDDLREHYVPVIEFECGGKIYTRVKVQSFENTTLIREVNIIEIARGIIVRVYYTYVVDQFTYYIN